MSLRLLLSITRCPNLAPSHHISGLPHPCSRILAVQSHLPPSNRHLPEPWNGDLVRAPLLFVSSNPSIDEDEEYPTTAWSDEDIADFFTHRFGGCRRAWVRDGLHPLRKDGSYKEDWVRFWAAVRKRAVEALGREDVRPGIDYALLELVRCKSRGEEGVRDALPECTRRYFEATLALAKAAVIICLGGLVRETMIAVFGIAGSPNVCGPVMIGGISRVFAFLPHPNARGKRSFAECLTPSELSALRGYLGFAG